MIHTGRRSVASGLKESIAIVVHHISTFQGCERQFTTLTTKNSLFFVSSFSGILVRKLDSERKEHFDKLIQGLTAFSNQLKKTSGPVFLPNSQLSSVDMSLIPWAYRYYVFEHYRGPEYKIPEDKPELQPYHEWFDHVMNLDSVQRTLPDKDQYLEHIGKYADGSARSKVANAVRRGVAAHELDDEKDEY